MRNRIFSSDRTKWMFMIVLVSIGAGFIAKNIIFYSTECIKEEMVTDFVLPNKTYRNNSISSL